MFTGNCNAILIFNYFFSKYLGKYVSHDFYLY